MASERIQRQIDQLLDDAGEALTQLSWEVVRDRAQAVLALDPNNGDAVAYLTAAARALNESLMPQSTGAAIGGPPRKLKLKK